MHARDDLGPLRSAHRALRGRASPSRRPSLRSAAQPALRRRWGRIGRLAPGLLAAASLAGCRAPAPPDTPPAPARAFAARTPLVFVPGITGSKLRDRETGKIVFGLARNVLWPHDDGYGIALSVAADGRAGLEAFAVVERVRSVFETLEVFGPLLALLEDNGYRRGGLGDPDPAQTLLPFAYDWRRDAVDSARELLGELARLREVRGEERLPVDLVCQSTGAHVCRYLAKYGGAALDDAEAGRAGLPDWLRVERVVLISSSNGGSLRTLRELDRGRRYVRAFGRVLRPEVFFTFRSLYQDLPCLREDLFVDANGEALDVDVCDAASWQRYGWSIYAEPTARRVARAQRADLFGDAGQRHGYLREQLARARRFQQLLQRDAPGFGSPHYFLIQDRSRDTPHRAVLLETGGGWRTRFSGDREVERNPALRALLTAPGDGHASASSQLALSPQERAAMARPPCYAEGGHFELIHDAAARGCLLDALGVPAP
ncbi:MAG TPA: hypothetical protein VIY27_00810 [Myxococcota bacterium]